MAQYSKTKGGLKRKPNCFAGLFKVLMGQIPGSHNVERCLFISILLLSCGMQIMSFPETTINCRDMFTLYKLAYFAEALLCTTH